MKKINIDLSKADQISLEALLTKGSLKSRIFKRIIGLLELSKGQTYSQAGRVSRLSDTSLYNLTKRYSTEGLKCLYDAPRSGRPVSISASLSDSITLLALETAPSGHSQWSLRLLSEKVVELGYCDQISHTKVADILKKKRSNPTW